MTIYKKISILFLLIITTFTAASSQQKTNLISLNINFIWHYKKENHDSKKHISYAQFNKMFTLDLNQKNYQIVFERSEIMNKLPVTLVLLVKPTKVTSKFADLQFEILEYGFSERGTIWTQPHLTLKNEKTAEIISPTSANPHINLKISGKWEL